MARRYRTKRLTAARGKLLGVLAAKATAPQQVAGSKPLSLDWSTEKVRAFMKTAEMEDVFEKKGRRGHSVHFISIISDDDIKPVDSFQLHMTVEDGSRGLISLTLTVPTHVPRERRTEVSAYCCYASSMVKAMKLHVDPRDGEVQAEMAIPVTALLGEPDKELHRIIGMPMMMLDEYLPGLYDVIGGEDPVKAFLDSLDGASNSSSANSRTAVGADGGNSSGGDISDCQSDITPALSKDYDLSGLNLQSRVPLDKIVGAVKKFRGKAQKTDPDSPRMNLLLSGPPGTGKTEFVKYLAAKVGAKVISVTASDLLSPLVGQTEQLIAKKFAEAKSKDAILFIDEIDSFLQSRERASHSWEVTQVNELLQQMERFSGVLVAATNFEERLDRAVLRRFVYKLKLDYLTDEGKEIFFKRYFKTSLSAEERKRLHAIRDLAPGDFRVVRQSLYYTDDHPTNKQRLDALEAESAAKGHGHAQVGF